MTESNDALSFVEQALRTLRDAPTPEGPPAGLLNATASIAVTRIALPCPSGKSPAARAAALCEVAPGATAA